VGERLVDLYEGDEQQQQSTADVADDGVVRERARVRRHRELLVHYDDEADDEQWEGCDARMQIGEPQVDTVRS
jgi:hypothetical protein